MDINQLKYFISVARTLNFSEAARINFVSQSTVSRYIGELEKEFNVKLFTRSRRNVVLTNEGKVLLPYALDILESLKKAMFVTNEMHKGGVGKISVTLDSASGSFVEKCLKEFKNEYPDITVELNELDRGDDSQILADSAYDFHFMLRDMLPDSEDIESIETHRDSLCMVVGKDYIEKGDKSGFKNLQNEPFVLLSEGESPILYMEIMDIFRTLHISPKILNTYDSVKAVMLAVGAGFGTAILPLQLAKMLLYNDVKIVPFEGIETEINYVLAYRKENSNPVAQLFLEIVKKLAKEELEDAEEFIV